MGAAPPPPPPPPPPPREYAGPPPPPPPQQVQKPPRQLPPVRRPGIDPEPRAHVRERSSLNLVLPFASVLGVLQGFLGVVAGTALLGLDSHTGPLSRPGGADTGMFIVSLVIILLSAAIIIAATRVWLPSRIARWFMVVFEVLAVVLTIGIAAHVSVLFNVRDLYLVAYNVTGIDYMHPLLALAIELAIIYALVFHRATRVKFARERSR